MPTEEQKERIENSVVRAFMVFLSLMLQIGWFVWLGVYLRQYYIVINGVAVAISCILALHVYSRHMNSAYKLSWIVLLLMMPVLGISMYAMFGSQASHVWVRRYMDNLENVAEKHLPADETALHALQQKDYGLANQCQYMQHKVGYPVYQNTDVFYHNDTKVALDDLKTELQNAEKFIFMEYHAIEDSSSWAEIESILKEKVASGVEVRILYDDVGSIFFVGKSFTKRLLAEGIQCRVFNPINPILNTFMNNRDHRKIVVIDGKVGFTGGYNMANRYFNIDSPYGYWKDTGIKLVGDAVKSLTVQFLEMWNATKREKEEQSRFFPEIAYQAQSTGFVQPYADTPLDNTPVGENVYLNLIKNAKHYVYITTPYLIIDDEMERELTLASQRGVDVRIVTPGIPDKAIAFKATRSHYARLVAYGVRIYEYTPGFMHAKQFVCDDEVAVVGTINLDFRSLYLHFENACWFCHCNAVHDVKADFNQLFVQSQEVTAQYSGKRSLTLRLGECIIRLLSPMM